MYILRVLSIISLFCLASCSGNKQAIDGPFMIHNAKLTRANFIVDGESNGSHIYFDRENRRILGIARNLRIILPDRSKITKFEKEIPGRYLPKYCFGDFEGCINRKQCTAEFLVKDLQEMEKSIFRMKSMGYPVIGASYSDFEKFTRVELIYYSDCSYILSDVKEYFSTYGPVTLGGVD